MAGTNLEIRLKNLEGTLMIEWSSGFPLIVGCTCVKRSVFL